MEIGIIGGGASGMAAAIAAARNPRAHVTVLERQARLGRKLLATGNGRCNLTNLHLDMTHYHGEDPSFAAHALTRLDAEGARDWFQGLGLYTVAEPSGRVYPYSDQANSVVDVLRFAMDKPNITLRTGFEVRKVKKTASGFLVESGEETLTFHRLIIACGGLAGTRLGGSLSGYQLLRSLGHRCTRLRPALVQVRTDWKGIAALKGVRANAHVDILHDGAVFAQSTGEIQFTEMGLSGPVMFEISRDVCQLSGVWAAKLDFLPDISRERLVSMLRQKKNTSLTCDDLFTGILHNRLGRVLTKAAGLGGSLPVAELPDTQLDTAAETAKAFFVNLTEPLGMDSAQVTAGGILTREFVPQTLESRLVPGLYACGEVLDIDGDCGGYNLQWAWSSGILAGTSCGKDSL